MNDVMVGDIIFRDWGGNYQGYFRVEEIGEKDVNYYNTPPRTVKFVKVRLLLKLDCTAPKNQGRGVLREFYADDLVVISHSWLAEKIFKLQQDYQQIYPYLLDSRK